jgi:hypothetical protein
MTITQAKLKAMFDYRDDGQLVSKFASSGNNNYAGRAIGWSAAKGYRHTKINGKTYRLHTLIWLWHHGEIPEMLDHINKNTSDNRIENLRIATPSQNAMNRKLFSNNTSGCRGVAWHKHQAKWFAYVDFNRRRKCLGYFDDLELADLVATEARAIYHGEFANVS